MLYSYFSLKKIMELHDLSTKELIDYYHMAEILCLRYENAVRMYDGTINQNTIDFNKFEKYNNIRNKIFLEIEKRVEELK